MKNIINNDSIHRVDPSAKANAEQIQKLLADQIHTNKEAEKDSEVKNETVQDSKDSDMVDDREAREKEEHQKRKRDKEEESNKKPKPKFMGGQIFDQEA